MGTIPSARLVIPPTAKLELMHIARDEHLRGIDFERLTIELQSFDLSAPIIATPAEVVRKFFPR